MRRPDTLSSGSVSKHQLTSGLFKVFVKPTGIWIQRLVSLSPASNKRTVFFGFSLKRFAKTQPADPAPMII